MDVTALYYSSNDEDSIFEKNIRGNILKYVGDMPLISVTQLPLKGFGKNICVGKQACCYLLNLYRQIQIGLREINTPYVLIIEDDILYPPKYFTFNPPEGGHCYRYHPVWLLTTFKSKIFGNQYHYKEYSDCAQVIDRDLWLNRINNLLPDEPRWTTSKIKFPRMTFKTNYKYTWRSEQPVIYFKTGHGMASISSTKIGVPAVDWLPFWGFAKDIIKRMYE